MAYVDNVLAMIVLDIVMNVPITLVINNHLISNDS